MTIQCFQLDPKDNVATVLFDAAEGDVLEVRGPGVTADLYALEMIRSGHKVALCAVNNGEPMVKYGFPIGAATRPIRAGEWVHLHNCRSFYDTASSSLDVESGVRTGVRYA